MTKTEELTDPNSCFNKAKPEEQMFVLLGRDKATANTVRYWVNERIVLGLNKPDDPQITGALEFAARLEAL